LLFVLLLFDLALRVHVCSREGKSCVIIKKGGGDGYLYLNEKKKAGALCYN
jgi:hypothetical protein